MEIQSVCECLRHWRLFRQTHCTHQRIVTLSFHFLFNEKETQSHSASRRGRRPGGAPPASQLQGARAPGLLPPSGGQTFPCRAGGQRAGVFLRGDAEPGRAGGGAVLASTQSRRGFPRGTRRLLTQGPAPAGARERTAAARSASRRGVRSTRRSVAATAASSRHVDRRPQRPASRRLRGPPPAALASAPARPREAPPTPGRRRAGPRLLMAAAAVCGI